MLISKLMTASLSCLVITGMMVVLGCAEKSAPTSSTTETSETAPVSGESLDEMLGEAEEIEVAELTAEDKALIEEQQFCPVGGKLGGMGTPVKVMVGEKPVFICCEHCRGPLLEDPEKFLADLAEKKKKAAAEEAQQADEPTAEKEAS